VTDKYCVIMFAFTALVATANMARVKTVKQVTLWMFVMFVNLLMAFMIAGFFR
jgi:uncharacterized protein with PQ loop repeat